MDYDLLHYVIDEYRMIYPYLQLVSGGAKGADELAELYADENELTINVLRANWKMLGKSAGFTRNRDIVHGCDEVVAFWDGKSKGTAHTIEYARKQGKRVIVIEYEEYSSSK